MKPPMKIKLFSSIAIIAITLVISPTVFGQVYKLKTTILSTKQKINEYKWSEWSEPIDASILITFDLTHDRITIYSKVTQVYDIAEYEGKTIDKDGDEVYSYFCVDKDGQKCRVKWLKLISQNGRMQMYVYYDDMHWLYNVYSLN